ncbi:dihydrofolate reductase [Noviherbaspirillum galbum]|uniref:Dihydrofolate reductase n=1 Tax=Noviherbaspirillum galbum TaxID=2709383 RepID=A0A6B3SLJ3_9BURK|nr:dihydrofolate reductase [Noviherbaspirillum galbum]NEX61673.1 dihydrofolate reductase [Noviherbaspirillum galbum]
MTTSHTPHLTAVVAMDLNGGIGIDNKLPWRLPEDMAHFKRTTIGHPVIMGRKTFDSIGKPLPNRRNIVVTRNAGWTREGVEVAHSVEEAVALVGDTPSCLIGGEQIFREAMPITQRLVVTEIGRAFDCDVFFPKIEPGEWKEVTREKYHSDLNGFDYAFVTLERV